MKVRNIRGPIGGFLAITGLVAALSAGPTVAREAEGCFATCYQGCIALYPLGDPANTPPRLQCQDDCERTCSGG